MSKSRPELKSRRALCFSEIGDIVLRRFLRWFPGSVPLRLAPSLTSVRSQRADCYGYTAPGKGEPAILAPMRLRGQALSRKGIPRGEREERPALKKRVHAVDTATGGRCVNATAR